MLVSPNAAPVNTSRLLPVLLRVSLALKAIESGYGACFVRACDLMEDLRRARTEHNLDPRMRVYPASKLLVADEFGIRPYDRDSTLPPLSSP